MNTAKNNPMTLFATRDAGNEGVKLPLVDPLTQEDTPHWVIIHSADSDAFHNANTQAMRNMGLLMKIPEGVERIAAVRENTLEIVMALVKDWSFAYESEHVPAESVMPCTPDNVREFLRSAPQIREAINQAATQRSLFLKSSSQNSGNGLSTTSSSAPSQPEVPQP